METKLKLKNSKIDSGMICAIFFKDPTPFFRKTPSLLIKNTISCRFNGFDVKTTLGCLVPWGPGRGGRIARVLEVLVCILSIKRCFQVRAVLKLFTICLHVMLCYVVLCLCLCVSCLAPDWWVQASGFARKVKRGKFHRFPWVLTFPNCVTHRHPMSTILRFYWLQLNHCSSPLAHAISCSILLSFHSFGMSACHPTSFIILITLLPLAFSVLYLTMFGVLVKRMLDMFIEMFAAEAEDHHVTRTTRTLKQWRLSISPSASHPLHAQSFPMFCSPNLSEPVRTCPNLSEPVRTCPNLWSAGKATSGGCCEESLSNGQETCPEPGSEVLGRSKNREEAQIAWGNMRKGLFMVVSWCFMLFLSSLPCVRWRQVRSVLSKRPRLGRAAEWSSGDIHGLGREAGARFQPRCAGSLAVVHWLYCYTGSSIF